MAERIRVTSFWATEDMDSDLGNIERRFQPGEYGEVVFQLDSKGASAAGRDYIERDINHLTDELESRGMESWPGEDLVTLDWVSKKISIRFVQTRTPSSMYQTPAYIGVAFVGARFAAAAAPVIARGGIWAFLLRNITKVGAKFARLGRGMSRSRALGLIGTGLLVWSLIDVDSLVEVFKWTGKKAGGFAKDLIGTPLLLGFGVLAVGVVLMRGGK